VLYKGNLIVAGRSSPYSLYLKDLASFGASSYDHADATGFINLYGLATGVAAIVRRGVKKETGQVPEIEEMAGFHAE
jgi:argininosuccinate synthase